ncbi:hypothetical protein [Polaribacter sp. IC073]|uniref:hypothetical protein n=1 Tax=Polaribacter sp. IC073 TaxID=2508540 RepID=UPI0011BF2013|nr:hypothetical protein [Polaribacter sp. IC073]TXD45985.1 hypothetical protein ES045_15445 [Polaribacter sp. IC073]
MKKLIILPILIITLFINSCSSDDDNSNPLSFEGNWSGQYTGEGDNGTWSMTIDGNGNISGTTISNVFSDTFDVNGNVQANGNLSVTIGTANSGATFIGEMEGTTASGTWNNSSLNYNGKWTGNKQ